MEKLHLEEHLDEYKEMLLRAYQRHQLMQNANANDKCKNNGKNKYVPTEKESRLLRCHLLTLRARATASHKEQLELQTRDHRAHNSHSNLTRAQHLALQELRHNHDLVIKPADKNLGAVVMDRAWYEQECMRQLSDQHFYRPVDQTTFDISHVKTALEDVLQSHAESRILSSNTLAFIKQHFASSTSSATDTISAAAALPHLPHFYILPKLHKTPVVGRPIVASHSYVLTNAAKWIDQQLQPVVAKLSHVLRDSRSLVSDLESTPIELPACVPSTHKIFLFTADVASLYTNIPHGDGLHALRSVCLSVGKMSFVKASLVADLMSCVLHNSYFQFASRVYHQVHGTAMGSPAAPCYANIFVYFLEQKWLARHRHQHAGGSVLMYRRYLDDVFGVICGESRESAMSTLQEMNQLHPDMKLTFELSEQEAKYLDLRIFKGPRFQSHRLFDTTTHFKAVNPFLYIHYQSYHSRAQKLGFIKAELIRMCRNSSSWELFSESSLGFYHRLLHRGYPRHFLQLAFAQVNYGERPQFLAQRLPLSPTGPSQQPPQQMVILKMLRNPVTTSVRWSSLLHPPLLPSESRAMVSWKLPPTLGGVLVRGSHSSKSKSHSNSSSGSQ